MPSVVHLYAIYVQVDCRAEFLFFILFYIRLFTGNDPANKDHPNSLRLILRGSPGPTA